MLQRLRITTLSRDDNTWRESNGSNRSDRGVRQGRESVCEDVEQQAPRQKDEGQGRGRIVDRQDTLKYLFCVR